MAELGSTTDPKALIPGEPAAISDQADSLKQNATAIAAVGRRLRGIDVPGWQGAGCDAFRDWLGTEAAAWQASADVDEEAAPALTQYAEALAHAQAQAADAIRLWQEGDRLTAEHAEAVADANLTNEHNRASGNPDRVSVPSGDPGAPLRENAQRTLDDAREAVEAAGARAAAALGDAAARAQQPVDFLAALGALANYVEGGIVDGSGKLFGALGSMLTNLWPDGSGADGPVKIPVRIGPFEFALEGGEKTTEKFGKEVHEFFLNFGNEKELDLGNTPFGGLFDEVKYFEGMRYKSTTSPEGAAAEQKVSVGRHLEVDYKDVHIGPWTIRAKSEWFAGRDASVSADASMTNAHAQASTNSGLQTKHTVEANPLPWIDVKQTVDSKIGDGYGKELPGFPGLPDVDYHDGEVKISAGGSYSKGVGSIGTNTEVTVDYGELVDSHRDAIEHLGEASGKKFRDTADSVADDVGDVVRKLPDF